MHQTQLQFITSYFFPFTPRNMKQCIAKTMIGLKLENCASENDSVDLTTLQETAKCIKGEAEVEIF